MVLAWWRKSVEALNSSMNASRKDRRRQRGSYKPWAEALADRALPSTVIWTNPAGGDCSGKIVATVPADG